MPLRSSPLHFLLVQLAIAGAMLPLHRPEGAAGGPLAGQVRRNGARYRTPLRLVVLPVGVQVLLPQAPQRLVSRPCVERCMGVVPCSRALSAPGPRTLTRHAFVSTRLKLIG
jgi:hypothetical protein